MAIQFSAGTKGELERAGYWAATTPEQRAIIDKMGFTTFSQVQFFQSEQSKNPALGDLFKTHEKNLATKEEYNAVLKSVGDRIIRDGRATNYDTTRPAPSVLDALGKDITGDKNEGNKERLNQLFAKGNAEQMRVLAGSISGYKDKDLGKVLDNAERATSPRSAPPVNNTKPASTAPKEEKTTTAPAKTAPSSPKVEPIQTVIKDAPAASEKSQGDDYLRDLPPPPNRRDLDQHIQEVNGRDPRTPTAPPPKSVMEIVATMSDEEIKEFMTPENVAAMAKGIKDYSDAKYPDLKSESGKFVDTINANGPGDPDQRPLQTRIAENLKRDPQLIRDLAKVMSAPDEPEESNGFLGEVGGSMAKAKKEGIRDTLKKVYAQPDKLASEDFTEKLSQKFKMAEGGIGGMIKGILGNDMGGMGGMLNSIGGFFKQIMNWFGKAFDAFSSGNFALMGNLDPNKSMTERFVASTQRAENAQAMKAYASAIPKSDALGPIGGEGRVVDAAGKPVMVDIKDDKTGEVLGQKQKMDDKFDHRVEYGGHKFYLTNGLQPLPVMKDGKPFGENHWTVVTKVDAKGNTVDVKEIVLSDADSKKLMDRLEREAAASGTKLSFATPIAPKEVNITSIDNKTGRENGQIQVAGGNIVSDTRPGSNVPANDADVKIYKLPEPEKIKATPLEPSVIPAV